MFLKKLEPSCAGCLYNMFSSNYVAANRLGLDRFASCVWKWSDELNWNYMYRCHGLQCWTFHTFLTIRIDTYVLALPQSTKLRLICRVSGIPSMKYLKYLAGTSHSLVDPVIDIGRQIQWLLQVAHHILEKNLISIFDLLSTYYVYL